MADFQALSYAGIDLLDSPNIIDQRTSLPLGSFEFDIGTFPGMGVFEVYEPDLAQIKINIGASGFGDLIFQDGVKKVILKKIYLQEAIIDTTDVNDKPIKYRLYLRDRRWRWRHTASLQRINVQTKLKTGTDALAASFEASTLNIGVVFSWQEFFDKIEADLGIASGLLPNIPVSQPQDIVYDYILSPHIMDLISEEVGFILYYDPLTDIFNYHVVGNETNLAIAALKELKRFRANSGLNEQVDNALLPANIIVKFPLRDSTIGGYRIPANRFYTKTVPSGIGGGTGDRIIYVGAHWRIQGSDYTAPQIAANQVVLDNIAAERAASYVRKLFAPKEDFLFGGIHFLNIDGYISRVRYTSNEEVVMTYCQTQGCPKKWDDEVSLFDTSRSFYVNEHGKSYYFEDFGASVYETSFLATDWLNDTLTIIQNGVPVVPGQIGSHGLAIGKSYLTQVRKGVATINLIDIQDETDIITGIVTLKKPKTFPDFAGRVVMSGSA